MSSTLIMIIIAVVLVAFFVLGMSLTLIFKGHHLKSEISENEHMQERGIKCAIQEAREEDGCSNLHGHDSSCAASGCSSCASGHSAN